MYAKYKGEVLLVVGVILSYLHVRYKLDFTHFHVGGMWGSIIAITLKDSLLVQKILGAVGVSASSSEGNVTITKTATVALLALGLGVMGGCQNLQPSTIQADTAAGISVALSGYAIAQPDKAKEIAADAQAVSDIINKTVLPTFQQGATSGQLLNSSVSQALTMLNTKIAGLKNGPMIVAEIKLALPLFTAALSGTASPTSKLSPQAQADLVAFFTGVSSGLAAFNSGTPK